MVGVAVHLLEQQPRAFSTCRSGRRGCVPVRAHAEGALGAREAVGGRVLRGNRVQTRVSSTSSRSIVERRAPRRWSREPTNPTIGIGGVGGAERGGALVLDERAALGVPEPVVRSRRAPRPRARLDRRRQRPPLRDPESAVEHHAHPPRYRNSCSAAPDPADALVLQAPVGADPVDRCELARQFEADHLDLLVDTTRRPARFAVDVELQLAVRGIADPDGSRATVALEMLERLLGRTRPSMPYMIWSFPGSVASR